MARIRSIKPEFWSDEKLSECSLEARLTFIGLWTFADDLGRLEYQLSRLRMQIYPCGTVSIQALTEYLRVLNERSLIRRYEVDGKTYLDIPGFQKHQRINRPTPSRLPEYSLNPHGALNERSRRRGGEGKGSEGRGVEGISSPQSAGPVDNSAGSAGEQQGAGEDFSGQNARPEEPSPRNGKALRVVERRNGSFEEINDTVEKLVRDWQIPVDEVGRLAQMAHISEDQVKVALGQLRDRGRLPGVAA